LILHGLEYNEIASKSPKDWRSRLDWLQRQAQFSPQPYEKLAEVLRESGHDEDARQILVEKNKGVSRQTNFPSLRWWRYKILGPMIGYGYRPFRAVWWGLGLILFGWVFFGLGYDRHIMLPTSENAYIKQDANPPGQTQTTPNGRSNGQRELSPAYPEFHSLAFSVETVVPLVNLYQAQYWLPRTDSGKWLSGWIWMSVFWLERIAGWILSLLFVAGVTGLLKT
jgi:hypothetical protein